MKDVRAQIRFKNNLLYKRIFERYGSVREFAEKHGLHPTTVGCYLNFKITPVSKPNTRHNRGVLKIGESKIKGSAVKIAKALECEVFDIFPEHLWEVVGKEYHIELESEKFLPYRDDVLMIEHNDTNYFNAENIRPLLATLTSQEEYVIRNRFGIDCNPSSLRKIAELIGRTQERVRQIEKKALRKLRHPSRAKHLKNK